jgi:Insertion element 4 transposase N-terminal
VGDDPVCHQYGCRDDYPGDHGGGGVSAPGHLGELTWQVPFELADSVLAGSSAAQRRLRDLPSRTGLYFVLVLGLFPQLSTPRGAVSRGRPARSTPSPASPPPANDPPRPHSPENAAANPLTTRRCG